MTENDLTTSLNLQPVSPLPDATKNILMYAKKSLVLFQMF